MHGTHGRRHFAGTYTACIDASEPARARSIEPISVLSHLPCHLRGQFHALMYNNKATDRAQRKSVLLPCYIQLLGAACYDAAMHLIMLGRESWQHLLCRVLLCTLLLTEFGPVGLDVDVTLSWATRNWPSLFVTVHFI
jgi:hypothetical protein